jgi:hypothetical protein
MVVHVYGNTVKFINNMHNTMYLLSQRTRLLEHHAINCHLLHVSAVFGRHQADFTTSCMTNTHKTTQIQSSSIDILTLRYLVHGSSFEK